MWPGCFLYLGPDFAWILSGILFWKGCVRMALFVTLVGVLIPIILFAIKGFSALTQSHATHTTCPLRPFGHAFGVERAAHWPSEDSVA